MSINSVVFADISSCTIGSHTVNGIVSVNVNEPADVRPLYGWGSALPLLKISTPTMGSGSLTYYGSDSETVAANWKTLMPGNVDMVLSLGLTSGNSGQSASTQTVTLKNVLYQGKSFSMNARGEGQISINFSFDDGLNGG